MTWFKKQQPSEGANFSTEVFLANTYVDRLVNDDSGILEASSGFDLLQRAIRGADHCWTPAEQLLDKAVELYRISALRNPRAYGLQLARNLNNLGVLNLLVCNVSQGEDRYIVTGVSPSNPWPTIPNRFLRARSAFTEAVGLLMAGLAVDDEALQGIHRNIALLGNLSRSAQVINSSITSASDFLSRGIDAHKNGEYVQAEEWYQKAVELGHPEAKNAMGILASDRGDTTVAAAWWKEAADEGHVKAMWSLGNLAWKQRDHAQSRDWWKRGADAGHYGSMNSLGDLCEKLGDRSQAVDWWQRAAEGGHASAAFSLGCAHHERGAVTQAIFWWEQAANGGDAGAMYNLGVIFEQSGGHFEAVDWYTRAAKAGSAEAQSALAELR